NDAKSLDDAMRLAFERYSGERGYRHEEFRALCAEVAGIPLGAFFEAAVDGVAELEFAPALAHYGLRFAAAEPADDPPAYLGVETAVEDHRLRITSILRGSPAAAAGLNVGDELLAFGDERVPPGGLEARLALYAPGEAQTVLVARRGRLLRLELTFAQAPESAFSLERDPLASPVQGAHLDAWLGPVDR
ncbi:MAG: PDZ domain-containing protein, partial [Myxococcales bacterium]|nr:PDZ domain-containing protein [Myxococcales bacterium]